MNFQKLFQSLPKQTEFYVVILLFVIIIFMAIYGKNGKILPFGNSTSLSYSPYEGFAGSYPEDVHNAANVSGQEEGAQKGTKGVLGLYDGLKAGPLESIPIHDPMSKLTGSPACAGSAYFNSLGGLCMTGEAKQAFIDRGGNYT
jgi:hypothetical protein